MCLMWFLRHSSPLILANTASNMQHLRILGTNVVGQAILIRLVEDTTSGFVAALVVVV